MTYGIADKYFCYLWYIVKVWLKTEMLIFLPELKRLKVFSNNNKKKKEYAFLLLKSDYNIKQK